MQITVTSSDGTQWKGDATQATPIYKYNGWRCLHTAEGGYPNPDHMPIVRPSLNIASVNMTQPVQLVSFRVGNRINPLYTGMKWRSAHGGGIAFTNNQGFDDPGAGPRVDYVNLEDLGSPLPKLMKGIICGGDFYTGTVSTSILMGLTDLVKVVRLAVSHGKELLRVKRSNSLIQVVRQAVSDVTSGNILVMTPGVDAIDATKPYSNIGEWANLILSKHWYFRATTRAGSRINNFPQGVGGPVLISYFLNKPAQYKLSWFERWVSNTLPDPLTVYHPI
jgi:hypothetical protein